jgi:sugar O-acyltransferase (sialic acid O-acetyltransferase NeuD family)
VETFMKKTVIFGTGTIAEVANYYFENDSDEVIEAFCVDDQYYVSDEYKEKKIVKISNLKQIYPPSEFKMFIAMSYKGINRPRMQKYDELKSLGYDFASYISTKATILNNHDIGDNAFILENNTVQPFSRIGNNVTLWSGNHIGHHTIVSNHNFISSHVVISGGVEVKEGCFIGVNSTFRDHITIGSHSVIGAGSIVMKNVPADSLLVPAKTEISEVPASKLRNF